MATSPLVGADRIEIAGESTVEEALPVGGYTYLRVDDLPGSWLVVSRGRPTVGQRLTWRGYAELRGFRSRRLDRTFDHLVFASIVEGER